jgi:hypothetical protein
MMTVFLSIAGHLKNACGECWFESKANQAISWLDKGEEEKLVCQGGNE